MPRYAMLIEYDGGPFNGWQRQAPEQLTVQGVLETALGRLEPGPHTIAAAGRTDAGVHATGQVAHCDLAKAWDPFRLISALNALTLSPALRRFCTSRLYSGAERPSAPASGGSAGAGAGGG